MLRPMVRRETRYLIPRYKNSDTFTENQTKLQIKQTKAEQYWRVNNVFLQIEGPENEHHYKEKWIKWKREFSFEFIRQSFWTFWKNLKTRLRNFYIDANQIAPYRWEWKRKYRNWDYKIPPKRLRSRVEEGRYKLEKRRNKLIRTLKFQGDPRIHHSGKLCQIVEINVSGTIFHAQERTLRRFPDTLLGDLEQRIRYYDPCTEQYFFERNATCFAEILNWYQRGGLKLIRPSKIPTSIFERELHFFGLPMEIIKSYRDKEEGQEPEPEKILPSNLLKRKYWLLFEYPESSKQAKMIVFGSVTAILLTIFCFCIESLAIFNDKDIETLRIKNSFRDPFFISETICIVWFTYETIVRFLCCPDKWDHGTNYLNILDVISILPYYIQTTIVHGMHGEEFQGSTRIIQLLRVTRVFRVFRIFKLSRHSNSLRILGRTLNASMQELILLTFLLVVTMVLFATAAYYGDYGPKNPFNSIPHAFWWALNTLTTVGYGDIYPISLWGRVCGMICCVAGILYVALPVPVIVANFNYYYARYNDANDSQPTEAQHKIMKSHHQEECEFRPACGIGRDFFQLKNFSPEDRVVYREIMKKRAIEKKILRKKLRKTFDHPPSYSTDSSSSQDNVPPKSMFNRKSTPAMKSISKGLDKRKKKVQISQSAKKIPK